MRPAVMSFMSEFLSAAEGWLSMCHVLGARPRPTKRVRGTARRANPEATGQASDGGTGSGGKCFFACMHMLDNCYRIPLLSFPNGINRTPDNRQYKSIPICARVALTPRQSHQGDWPARFLALRSF